MDDKGAEDSCAIFCLNKIKIEEYPDEPKKEINENSGDKQENIRLESYAKEIKDIFVNPNNSENERLISQNGLFTFSPSGDKGLETKVLGMLSKYFYSDICSSDCPLGNIDINEPNEVKEYIFKINISIKDDDRSECMRALRRMNIHHATLFPDLMGSSLYCNELFSNNK